MGSPGKTVLVTGGAGFIGTHTVVQLLKDGFGVSVIDNLDNSVPEAVDRVRELVGPELSEKLEFHLVLSFLNFVSVSRFGELGVCLFVCSRKKMWGLSGI